MGGWTNPEQGHDQRQVPTGQKHHSAGNELHEGPKADLHLERNNEDPCENLRHPSPQRRQGQTKENQRRAKRSQRNGDPLQESTPETMAQPQAGPPHNGPREDGHRGRTTIGYYTGDP